MSVDGSDGRSDENATGVEEGDAARSSAAAPSSEPLWRRLDLPPIWLIGFILLSWFLAIVFPIGAVSGLFFDIVALILATGAIGLGVWAAIVMSLNKTPVMPRRDASELVTSGPFRFTRNPIYVADLALLLAFGFWRGSIWPLVLTPALLFVLERRFILAEEARLEALFGDAYRDYKARVRRWL